jgi:DNA-binding response OmpR family regulator
MTKPFRANELIARIEAVLRRAQLERAPNGLSLIQVGNLTIDLTQRQVQIDGLRVDLTPIEYQILAYLARHVGQVLTHEQILAEVWGEEYAGENHYLWVHMAHLRRKLEPDSKQPRYILTERGVGYRLAKE